MDKINTHFTAEFAEHAEKDQVEVEKAGLSGLNLNLNLSLGTRKGEVLKYDGTIFRGFTLLDGWGAASDPHRPGLLWDLGLFAELAPPVEGGVIRSPEFRG